jgi:hypothetical protein
VVTVAVLARRAARDPRELAGERTLVVPTACVSDIGERFVGRCQPPRGFVNTCAQQILPWRQSKRSSHTPLQLRGCEASGRSQFGDLHGARQMLWGQCHDRSERIDVNAILLTSPEIDGQYRHPHDVPRRVADRLLVAHEPARMTVAIGNEFQRISQRTARLDDCSVLAFVRFGQVGREEVGSSSANHLTTIGLAHPLGKRVVDRYVTAISTLDAIHDAGCGIEQFGHLRKGGERVGHTLMVRMRHRR